MNVEMTSRFLSDARFRVYLDFAESHGIAEDRSLDVAVRLYRWNVDMAAEVMKCVAYLEVFVRNAIDAQLLSWIRGQRIESFSDWIDVEGRDPIGRIRKLVNADGQDHFASAKASALYKRQAWKSDSRHPRHGDMINRDDVFAQFTFGAWESILRRSSDDPELAQVLMGAFPYIERAWELETKRMPNAKLPGNADDSRSDRLRKELVSRLRRIRDVRNRASHEENLLRVEFPKVRRDMLFVLGALDPECIRFALPDSAESLKRADPMQIVVTQANRKR